VLEPRLDGLYGQSSAGRPISESFSPPTARICDGTNVVPGRVVRPGTAWVRALESLTGQAWYDGSGLDRDAGGPAWTPRGSVVLEERSDRAYRRSDRRDLRSELHSRPLRTVLETTPDCTRDPSGL
jgi:hypothetical protein